MDLRGADLNSLALQCLRYVPDDPSPLEEPKGLRVLLHQLWNELPCILTPDCRSSWRLPAPQPIESIPPVEPLSPT